MSYNTFREYLDESTKIGNEFDISINGIAFRVEREFHVRQPRGNLKIPLYSVNIDEEPDLASELNIRSVPTTFIYNSEITTILGVKPEADIRDLLA